MRKIIEGSILQLRTGDIVRINDITKLDGINIYEGREESSHTDMIFVKRDIVKVFKETQKKKEIFNKKMILTEVEVLEVKSLGEFQHGETAIVSLNLDKTSKLYLEHYKKKVMEYLKLYHQMKFLT